MIPCAAYLTRVNIEIKAIFIAEHATAGKVSGRQRVLKTGAARLGSVHHPLPRSRSKGSLPTKQSTFGLQNNSKYSSLVKKVIIFLPQRGKIIILLP